MFATLDLQLISIEHTSDVTATGASGAGELESSNANFAHVLRARTDSGSGDSTLVGEFLPLDGNALPPDLLSGQDGSDTAGPSPAELLAQDGLDESHTDLVALAIGSNVPPGNPGGPNQATADPISTVMTNAGSAAQTTGDSPDNKGNVRVFVPPTRARSGDTTPRAIDQTATLTDRRNGPEIPGVPVVRGTQIRAQKLSDATSDRQVRTSSLEQTNLVPSALKLLQVKLSEVDTIRDNLRQSFSKMQQSVSGSNGQSPPGLSLTATSNGGAGVSSFSTDLELATYSINTPVRDAQWGDRIGERVLMLAGNQLKTAEIRLTPAELGPLRVQISVEEGSANVAFQAHHAATRDAVELAMPRLRELLAENGLTLGDTSVSEQDLSQGQNEPGGKTEADPATVAEDEVAVLDSERSMARPARAANGLIDTFV